MSLANNESLLEKEFQTKIYINSNIKNSILNILGLSHKCEFLREIEFINGITSDFIIQDNNTIKAIIECKRADIGVTEYVRGIGQLFQYEYFQDKNICPKKYGNLSFDKDINNNILIIPSNFIINTNLNIGRFRYPNNSMIFEIHTKNNRVRQITNEELERLEIAGKNSLITISQYYIRDVRIFECYILFQILGILNNLDIKKNRKEIEEEILRNITVINNKNWRNAFITLSSLGFIGSASKIYDTEMKLLNYNISDFINLVYEDYLYPFIDTIMSELLSLADDNGFVNISNKELAKNIRKKYHNKNILFLTDSNERYMSSWMNIIRDDLGCVYFEPRKNIRKINFIPKNLNKNERINKITLFSKSKNYIDNFNLMKKGLIKGVL